MFLQRGIVFSHEAVRKWEAKLAPVLAGELRRRRRGKGGAGRRSWFVDETYLKVRGRWCYLYRAIDRNGDLVDTMLSEHRDRSEEHTSELQSRQYLVCRLLLEKKKKRRKRTSTKHIHQEQEG